MMTPVAHFFRLVRIGWVMARHGALFPMEALGVSPIPSWLGKLLRNDKDDRTPGKRLSAALQALGPAFIKLGQALSTRSDLVGEAVALDLAELQDRVPAFDEKKAIAVLENELQKPVSELFRHFETTPVAAASIAQVHFAELYDGREVAVKILRPGVDEQFSRDIELFYWVARLVEKLKPELRRLKPVEVVQMFERSVQLEMDLRMEAASASQLRENLAEDDGIYVPKIEWQYTSQRILTLERIRGISIGDIPALRAAGHDFQLLANRAADIFFNQVFRDGFFHADLHPGNMFVQHDGTIAVIDFGIMGQLDYQTRLYLAEMLYGFLKRDYKRVARVHFDAKYVPNTESMEAFALACRSIGEPIFDQPLAQISIARLLAQLFRITETFHMETQPQLLLLQKTMMMVEGIGRSLTPGINVWQLSEPLIERWMQKHFSPQKRLQNNLHAVYEEIQKLPHLRVKFEQALEILAKSSESA